MAKKNFVVPIIALLSVLGMTGCEKAASTFAPSIGENGNWWVAGTDTGVAAQGPKGDTGASPTISISEDGYWVINGSATDVKAEGTAGAPGQTPTVSINADGFWVINGVATDVSAQGPKGDPGTTPTVSINADGYWVINGTATDVKAEGSQGAPGSSPTVEIGIDDCWWINGVSTGMPAIGHDGNPGAPGTPGATGPEGKSAFEIFMEYYPHYTGTEADWIKGVADGTLADNMPKAGHSGDWHYNPETGKIERTCDVCGEVEIKDATLPEFVSFAVTEDSVPGIFTVTNESSKPWTFADGIWKSGNKGSHSTDSILVVTPALAGSTITFHVHASGEGSSTLYDYFSTSVGVGGSSSIGGTRIGTPTGMDSDVVFTFTADNVAASMSYHKDSNGSAGDDEAVVTNLKVNVPTSSLDDSAIPDAIVINFDSGNGDADTQEVIWVGSGVNMPTPSRTGYSFGGWYSDAACTVPAPATFDESCTLYAKWTMMHKVTVVDYVRGEDDATFMVNHNDTLDIEIPSDEEKVFGGFYVAPSCAAGTEFDIGSPIKRDTIIYCKWNNAPAYCGAYQGVNMWNGNFASAKSLTIAPNGTMTGYYTGTVTGINEDGSLVITGSSSGDKLYVVDDMIIGISAYGSDSDLYVFVKGQDPYSSTSNPFIASTGLTSGGSSKNYNGRLFSVDRGGDVTNYCIFGDTIYKNVTVSSLDGDFTIGQDADTYGKDICVKDENGVEITTQTKRAAVDADYGVYTDADSHVLKVYGDGSSASIDGQAISYTKSGDVLSYIEGYVVTSYQSKRTSGWSTQTGTMTWDETAGKWKHTIGSDVTITDYDDPAIVWETTSNNYFAYKTADYGSVALTLDKATSSFTTSRPTFTVTKHVGENVEIINARSGNVVELGTPSVASNEQFEGWFDNSEFTGDPITSLTVTGEVYAKIVNVYKLIVHKNLTTEDVTETVVFHADEVMTPPEVVLEGSDFDGWYTDASFNTTYVPGTNVESVEIYAKWIKGKYANSAANWFDSFDPSEQFIDEITWDGGVYAWKKDSMTINDTVYQGMKSGNYHSTTPSNIMVKFKADAIVSFDWLTAGESNFDYLSIYKNGDKIVDGKGKSTHDYSSKTATLYTESKTVNVSSGDILKFSYTQDSAYYEPDCGFIWNLSIVAPTTSNLTLDPNYDGGTPVVIQANVGFDVKPEDPTEREGYVFDGWYLEDTCETAFDPSTVMPAEGLTLYAKWVEAVNLTVHDGDEITVMAVKPNTKPDMSAFDKAGFVTLGYYAEDTFDTPVDLSSGIAEDTEVFVKYLDATVFVGKYVGYNMMSSTAGKVQTDTAITNSGYRASFNDSLVGVDSKASGKTITGYSDGMLITDGGKMLCAIADDGTVFLCNRYSGFTENPSISGKDLMFAVNTGSEYDGTVTIVNNVDESGNWIVTVTKGGKVYTIYLNFTANTMTITSVVDE